MSSNSQNIIEGLDYDHTGQPNSDIVVANEESQVPVLNSCLENNEEVIDPDSSEKRLPVDPPNMDEYQTLKIEYAPDHKMIINHRTHIETASLGGNITMNMGERSGCEINRTKVGEEVVGGIENLQPPLEQQPLMVSRGKRGAFVPSIHDGQPIHGDDTSLAGAVNDITTPSPSPEALVMVAPQFKGKRGAFVPAAHTIHRSQSVGAEEIPPPTRLTKSISVGGSPMSILKKNSSLPEPIEDYGNRFGAEPERRRSSRISFCEEVQVELALDKGDRFSCSFGCGFVGYLMEVEEHEKVCTQPRARIARAVIKANSKAKGALRKAKKITTNLRTSFDSSIASRDSFSWSGGKSRHNEPS